MRLGIYGGTFSPVHNAHVGIANAFLTEFKLDKLIIVPSGKNPPHKTSDNRENFFQHRLEMCKLAFRPFDKISVSDIEVSKEGVSYTVLTLKEFASNDIELYFLCGSDAFFILDKWVGFEDIIKMCTVVCAKRNLNDSEEMLIKKKISELKEKYGANIEELRLPPVKLSSTEIRDGISRGYDMSSFLPEKVWEYIKMHKLYR